MLMTKCTLAEFIHYLEAFFKTNSALTHFNYSLLRY